jgi:3-oxoacyl-[acyl-carrier protein] reductase
MRLENKRTVVTGAARGIGNAIARMFAREGARVVLADIDESAGQSAAAAICGNGGAAVFLRADVSKGEDVQRLMDTAAVRLGGIDVLVNNAGRWSGDGRLLETPEEVWENVLQGCLKSVYWCSKQALPHLIDAGGGSIVNISSVNALLGIELTAYTAAKAGIIGLTRLLAAHYGLQGVRVNVICPGSIETEGVRPEFERSPELRRKLAGLTQLGRIGTPDDVAFGALYLASDEAAFVTGAVFVIDGGLTSGLSPEYGNLLGENAL